MIFLKVFGWCDLMDSWGDKLLKGITDLIITSQLGIHNIGTNVDCALSSSSIRSTQI